MFDPHFKVNHECQVINFNLSEILDLENVRIDPKNKIAAYIQPELKKDHTMIVCDPNFKAQLSRSRDFVSHC